MLLPFLKPPFPAVRKAHIFCLHLMQLVFMIQGYHCGKVACDPNSSYTMQNVVPCSRILSYTSMFFLLCGCGTCMHVQMD